MPYKLNIHMFLWFLFFMCFSIDAQQEKEEFDITSAREMGIPPIEHYSLNKDFDLYSSTEILQHPNGLIYVSCKQGLLEFDGSRWELVFKKDKIYKFSISEKGYIYIMTPKDFGVLKRDSKGEYYFTSFLPYLNLDSKSFGSLRSCIAIKHNAYFIYSDFIFEWNHENSKHILVHKPPNSFSSGFEVNQEIYVHDASSKIYLFEKGKYTFLEGTEAIPKKTSVSGTEINNKLIFATSTGGGYRYNNNSVEYIFQLDDEVKFTPNSFLSIDANRLVVGTKNKGILLYSNSGELLSAFNESSDFITDRIYNLYLDKDKNLWVSHDKGVSKIEFSSPFSFYSNKRFTDDILGSIEHQQKLYYSTRSEVYELNTEKKDILESKQINRIFKDTDLVDVESYNDLLLFTSSKGLYAYKNQKKYKITDSQCYFVLASKVYKGLIYVSGEKGIFVYRDLGDTVPLRDRFKKVREIEFIKPQLQSTISFFLENKNGDLIVNLNFKDILRIESSSSLEYRQEVVDVPTKNTSHINTIHLLNEEVVIMVEGVAYKFDTITGEFKKHSINKYIKKLDFQPLIIYQKDQTSNIIFSTGAQGKTVIASLTEDGDFILKKGIFDRYPKHKTWSIFEDSRNMLWLMGTGGLVRFDSRLYKTPQPVPKVLIRNLSTLNDSIVFKDTISNTKNYIKFSYKNNSIKLKYAFPEYTHTESNRFKYILEGFNDTWSDWSSTSEKEFNNLSEGTYTFIVKAKNVYDQESDLSSFTFVVLPPWYRTWWAYLLYILGAIVFVVIVVKWRSSKLEKEKEILEKTVKERTLEIINKNEQLEKQAAKLKEMDKVKSRFFANISHEFRTPITLIKGPIREFMDNHETEFGLDKAEMVGRNADRLLQLVNQLLDLSKLDAGSLELEPVEADINQFLRSLCSAFDSHAEQRNITYEISIGPEKLITSFDKDKLDKIVSNLLSNAFKYSFDNGRVRFSSSIQENQIIIVVSDRGIGISEEKQPYILDRFYQIDSSSTRNQEGTGIGLSLVKELVELHKGSISVESSLQKGTTFLITLPLPYIKEGDFISKNEHKKTSFKSNSNVKNKKSLQHFNKDSSIILVVEDNDDMRKYIVDCLKDQFQFIEGIDGLMGLKKAKKYIPDLIITDVMMPQMDGISMCKKLKEDQKTSHIPIVMLTAKVEQEDKLLGLNIGVDDYLVKPFDSKELKLRVHNLIQQRNLLRARYSQKFTLEPKQVIITSNEEVFLEKVIESIEQNLSDAEFGVPQMQTILMMSKTQLYRKMKALTDQAPGEFLRNYRLKRSTQFFLQEGDNVSEVAYSVGFNSVSYFTKCFKSLFGMPPTEFMKKQNNKE